MKEQKIIGVLLRCGLFRDAEEAAAEAMREGVRVSYLRGEKVFFGGGALGVLLSGRLRVGGRADRKKLVLTELPAGAVFGFSSLFEGAEHFETDISSAGPCEVLWISEELLSRLILQNGRIGMNVIAMQARKIRFLNEQVLSFSSPDNAEKLCRWLCRQTPDEDGVIVLPMGMAALAAHLGMGRASLYRAFGRLCEDGRLKKEGENRFILQIPRET